ncbi:uncharacterized protein LOC113872354 [Abrus precatorius]|uniref:Uncharacterized protein LOC113872354 n=1 Tax=Abrus precatorius TaxID=3816 RepID=A0A8B8MCS7_ABRPR|nr:uncharacterized protein LOC113872354 [Abrus precatorius]XP_027365652.1 uncharacterized protein LOC113872354 [Abrus precatorius]
MKQFAIQNVVVPSHEEISGRDSVICPKPRRLGLFNLAVNEHSARTFRWHLSCQDPCDSNSSGSNPLETILTKEGDCDMEQSCPMIASSPPFFCGSPPSRVANPLIQDARFGDENFSPLSPSSWVVVPAPAGLPPSPSSSARKGGCVRANFGNNPAVRIEGFDCLDRDSRNCSIPALA